MKKITKLIDKWLFNPICEEHSVFTTKTNRFSLFAISMYEKDNQQEIN